jgi:hypothetical protein
MWIDADSRNNTGLTGADYGIFVEYHNDTHTWSKIFEEFSMDGSARIIDKQDNFTNFLSTNVTVMLETYYITFHKITSLGCIWICVNWHNQYSSICESLAHLEKPQHYIFGSQQH